MNSKWGGEEDEVDKRRSSSLVSLLFHLNVLSRVSIDPLTDVVSAHNHQNLVTSTNCYLMSCLVSHTTCHYHRMTSDLLTEIVCPLWVCAVMIMGCVCACVGCWVNRGGLVFSNREWISVIEHFVDCVRFYSMFKRWMWPEANGFPKTFNLACIIY